MVAEFQFAEIVYKIVAKNQEASARGKMMKNVVVLGAGRSSQALIRYLLEKASALDWKVIVGDHLHKAASEAVGNHPRGSGVQFDITNSTEAEKLISTADIVLSLLPPSLHIKVAERCLKLGKHLVTASYTSPEMKAVEPQVLSSGLIFLNECGLDPGIDHMSAMRELNLLRSRGASIEGFESFAGGLISPSSSPENPWRYKFTWNPGNVVTAGQPGPAEYIKEGRRITIPYKRLFEETRRIYIDGYGDLEAYANRDSVSYVSRYGLDNVQNMLRGTLRFAGFCSAWQVLVRLGCCFDNPILSFDSDATHRDFLAYFLPEGNDVAAELSKTMDLDPAGDVMKCLRWSGFFDAEPIGMSSGTPARFLEHILMKKWKLNADDRDLVLMVHRIVYTLDNRKWETTMHLAVEGTNETTAMAQTVGLPLGIAARLILENRIKRRGVLIPVIPEIYDPILHELSAMGINFSSQTVEIKG